MTHFVLRFPYPDELAELGRRVAANDSVKGRSLRCFPHLRRTVLALTSPARDPRLEALAGFGTACTGGLAHAALQGVAVGDLAFRGKPLRALEQPNALTVIERRHRGGAGRVLGSALFAYTSTVLSVIYGMQTPLVCCFHKGSRRYVESMGMASLGVSFRGDARGTEWGIAAGLLSTQVGIALQRMPELAAHVDASSLSDTVAEAQRSLAESPPPVDCPCARL